MIKGDHLHVYCEIWSRVTLKCAGENISLAISASLKGGRACTSLACTSQSRGSPGSLGRPAFNARLSRNFCSPTRGQEMRLPLHVLIRTRRAICAML